MKNQQLQRLINHTIVFETQKLINEQVGNMPTTVEEMLGSYEIKNNQRQVLSLSLSNYTYHYHAAHGMTYIKSLTFDLEKGKQCQLKDLFKPGVDYVKRLSDIINGQIKQRDFPLLNVFTTIKPNQDFYMPIKLLSFIFNYMKSLHIFLASQCFQYPYMISRISLMKMVPSGEWL